MKLDTITNREILIDNILLQERIGGQPYNSGFNVFNDTQDDDIEHSYVQLEILQSFLATGNPGVFVNRQPNQLRESDITPIKNAILQMLMENKFFENINFKSGNGAQNLSLIGHGIGHAIEFTLLTTLTGVLAGVTGEEALHGDVVLAALSGAGAAAGAYGVHKQIATIRALWAAYKLYRIISKFERYTTYDPKTYKRGLISTFLDWIEGKTPDQIRKECIRKVQTESTRKQMEFERAINHLPKFVTVRGNDGEDKKIPIESFFNYD